jgi:protein-disulfide isomerase
MVEFTDYQCPFCRRFHEQTFPELQKHYIDSGRLRFVSMDLPLGFHANAENAAHAAHCAGEQGRYWELRDVMIRNAAKLGADQVRGYAQGLALNLDAFDQCLESRRHQALIHEDKSIAQGAGITGTPSFVIGKTDRDGKLAGIKLVGAQPYAAFAQVLDQQLEALVAPPTKEAQIPPPTGMRGSEAAAGSGPVQGNMASPGYRLQGGIGGAE